MTDRGAINQLLRTNPDLILVGDCPTGCDRLVMEAAANQRIERVQFKANWVAFGDRAGPMRNGAMVKRLCNLDPSEWTKQVHGYPDRQSRGTLDCMIQARRAGLDVFEHRDWEGAHS
jgi:hypothetical protein